MLLSVSLVVAVLSLPLNVFADTSEETSSEASTIQSNETTNLNPEFTPQEKIREEKMDQLKQLAPTNSNFNEINSNEISLRAAVLTYNIEKLSAGNTITSINSFKLPAGSKPTLTLVQYPYSGGNGTVKAFYTLVNVDTGNEISDSVIVNKNYTHTNYSYTFSNVPAGTYKVRIYNYDADVFGGSVDMMGNGYITL